jgi:hypothetical protein
LSPHSTYYTRDPTEDNITDTKNDAEDQDSKTENDTDSYSIAMNDTERKIESLAYKKVANKTRPIATTLPEEFRIVRRIPSDPLVDLPTLPTHPPEFEPGERYTRERMEAMPVNKDGFLWPEEVKLVHYLIREHEFAFAWNENEKGKFSDEYFDPVVIPTVEHVPWVLRNISIPPGIYDQVVEVIKHKIRTGVFESSNSSYRSRWFCVLKKDGKSLRLVHDLQPLNAITIRDSALIPMVEQYAESFGGRACYAMFDLFVGFDQRALDIKSRDLTTFQTPLGTFRMTSIPMGYTNSVQIQQGDITFILQEEIPHVTVPFIDDIPVKGPTTRYTDESGSFETIPENRGIRRFIWEHLLNVNRVIQRIKHAGGTFSGLKSYICVESTIIVGHRCTYEGRIPDESRIQKIRDWPICRNLTEVRGFLGTLGTIRVFIKNFAMHARPLVQLTRKNVEFEFGGEHLLAMEKMKYFAQQCPAIRAINYQSDNEVILSVDSSWMAVGFILSQLGDDGKRYPSRFGSIMWNEREQKYSQAKIELYGLFRALKAVKLFIVSVKNLTMEVDAKYIKGMINNPDIQPSATINRWIAGILLFNFRLKHVPGKDHASADGLSRRPQAPEDPIENDDHEDWIDTSYAFGVELLNWTNHSRKTTSSRFAKAYLPHSRKRSSQPTDWPSILIASLSQDQVEIPRTDRAKARDEEILRVQEFLEDPDKAKRPNDKDFKKFVRSATKFFVNKGQIWRKDRHGKHKLVIPSKRRLGLIRQAHDDLGHKGIFTVRNRLLEHFWWPNLDEDVKWYIRTCHECQLRLLHKIIIPPTVPNPGGLFRKVYVDTMLMPKAKGYRYIIHARCSLTSYPEWKMVRHENYTTIATFLHELACRWGAIEVIVTDNAPQYLQAAELFVEKHHIRHIKISPYNSRAQGPIERRHFDVRESIMKAAEGDESKWPDVAPAVFWAERVTIQKSTGYSPYYLAHGVEPLLPFDLAEATYLAPDINGPMTTEDLVALRAKMLLKRPQDLQRVREKVLKARWESVKQLEKDLGHRIKEFNFHPGQLVLVRNSRFDKGLTNKTKPRFLRPMVVIRKTKGGSYILGELDGALSKLRFAAFRLIPYLPRDIRAVPVTKLADISEDELEDLTHDSGNALDVDFDAETN